MTDPTAPQPRPGPRVEPPAGDAPESPRRAAGVRPFEGFSLVVGWGLRRGFSGRRFRRSLLLAALLGAVVGFLCSRDRDAAESLFESLDHAILAVGIPLTALAIVGRGYAEEVAEHTLVYHLVRPVSRVTVFFARFVSGLAPGVATGVVLVLVATIVSGVALPAPAYLALAGVAALGTATVGAVYYTLAAVFRRGLVAGLVYTLVVEGLFQFLPGTVQKLSLMHHVRSVFHQTLDADFADRSAAVRAAVDAARQVRLPGTRTGMVLERATEMWSTTGSAVLVCAVAAGLALLYGARVVKRRDFSLKET